MSAYLAHAKRALQEQPFGVFLGTEITVCSPEEVEVRLRIRNELTQQDGFVHGGLVGYLADTALGFAGGVALGSWVVTSEFKVNFIRPAMGEELIARASAVHAGKTQAVCRCEVFAKQGDEVLLCAIAQGTIARSST
jgi:uncharacterized protein (TIGR00369 family)